MTDEPGQQSMVMPPQPPTNHWPVKIYCACGCYIDIQVPIIPSQKLVDDFKRIHAGDDHKILLTERDAESAWEHRRRKIRRAKKKASWDPKQEDPELF